MKNRKLSIVALMAFVLGIQTSFADDFNVLLKKAKSGDAEAMCEIGGRYRNGIGINKDRVQADRWTQKAASNGCLRAIGLCYEFAYGTTTNLSEATRWYRKAADRGDGVAMSNLGNCYAC